MQDESRIRYWDYLKGLCIFFVLFDHFRIRNVLNGTVYNVMSFCCLGAFFLATGFFYVSGKRTFAENVKRRFKSIMIPFWTACIVYGIFEIFRANWFGYADIKKISVITVVQMIYASLCMPKFGFLQKILTPFIINNEYYQETFQVSLPCYIHLWFLPAMFTASVIFYFLAEKTLKNHYLKILSVAILILLGSFENFFPIFKQLPWGLGRGFIGAALMLCGFWLKEYKILEIKNVLLIIASILVCIVITVLIVLSGKTDGGWVVFSSGYSAPLLIFIVSLSGTWVYLWLFKAFDRIHVEWIKNVFELVGKFSMQIYLWHILIRDILAFSYLHIRGIPAEPDLFIYEFLPDDGISMTVNFIGLVLSVLIFGFYGYCKNKSISKK